MKISSRGRYAVRIMLDIAANQLRGHVTMKDVAERQEISKKYGDQIALQLTQAGLLVAARGRQGGYRLVRPAEEVTVLEILRAVEGSMVPVQCMETEPNPCERCEICLTLPIWQGLDRVMTDYLGSITLRQALEQQLPEAIPVSTAP